MLAVLYFSTLFVMPVSGVYPQSAGFLRTCTLPSVALCFFSSRRRHAIFDCDWSSDVCSSDLELAVPLPAGYARRPSGEVALDPDEQVQAVIRLVFRLFDELGTVHAVLRFLVEHQVRIGMRERSGPGKGEVAWRAPHQQGLVNLLRNPAYAGIYAYGRSRTDPSRRLPGRGHSGRVRRLEAGEVLGRVQGAAPAEVSGGAYQRHPAP